MGELVGVALDDLQEPIRVALQGYADYTDEKVSFDTDAAADLELTPHKPNWARSETEVQYLGKHVGKLTVIAFKPKDGTGDDQTHSMSDVTQTGPYPRETSVIPRCKRAVHTEAHLTIASLDPENAHADPKIFAGSLDLVTLQDTPGGKMLYRLGSLGYRQEVYQENIERSDLRWSPLTSVTVGYRNIWSATDRAYRLPSYNAVTDTRFGDPHAVYNATSQLQICAFIGIAPEVIWYGQGTEFLGELNARVPELLDSVGRSLNKLEDYPRI